MICYGGGGGGGGDAARWWWWQQQRLWSGNDGHSWMSFYYISMCESKQSIDACLYINSDFCSKSKFISFVQTKNK